MEYVDISTVSNNFHGFSLTVEPSGMPRRKRERVFTHYLKALAAILNYFDVPESTHEFIQAVIIAANFPEDAGAEFQLTDSKIAGAVTVNADTQARAVERFRKQRERLATWQNSRNESGLLHPAILGISSEYDAEQKKRFYSYRLVICDLVRKTIERAPVNSKADKLETQARITARAYLAEMGIRPKVRKAKRVHSPESNFKRALTLLQAGFESESLLHGEDSARNLLRKALLETAENDNSKKAIFQIMKELSAESTGIFPIGYGPETGPELEPETPPALIADGAEEDGQEGPESWEDTLEPEPGPAEIAHIGNKKEYEQFGELPGGAPRSSHLSNAVRAVELFASIGVTSFGETTEVEGRKEYEILSLEAMSRSVDDRIDAAESWASSYIVRPIIPPAEPVKLIQLDDFDAEKWPELEELAFIAWKTSEKKSQAFIAVRLPDPGNDTLRLHVRRSLIAYFGADNSASGAARFPGSLNTKYTPAFPVSITFERPGRIVEYSDIEGFLLPAPPAPAPRVYRPSSLRPFPDWELEASRQPTRVLADWYWSLKSLDRQRGIDETIEELLRVSSKAQAKPRSYAEGTVRNAARAMCIL